MISVVMFVDRILHFVVMINLSTALGQKMLPTYFVKILMNSKKVVCVCVCGGGQGGEGDSYQTNQLIYNANSFIGFHVKE